MSGANCNQTQYVNLECILDQEKEKLWKTCGETIESNWNMDFVLHNVIDLKSIFSTVALISW